MPWTCITVHPPPSPGSMGGGASLRRAARVLWRRTTRWGASPAPGLDAKKDYGPYGLLPARRRRSRGRGACLLSCGDVEANPGPGPGGALTPRGKKLAKRTPLPSDMEVDPLSQDGGVVPPGPLASMGPPGTGQAPQAVTPVASSPRAVGSRARLHCWVLGCPLRLVASSRETLARHVSAVHLPAGVSPPEDVLLNLGMAVCTRCVQLHTSTSPCPGCGGAPGPAVPLAGGYAEDGSSPVPSLPAPPRPPLASQGTHLSHPSPEWASRLQRVLVLPAPTIRHIPSAAQAGVAQALEGVLADFLAHLTWETWFRAMAFPKLVLRAARGGRGHLRQLASELDRRLRLWRSGSLDLLEQELLTSLADRPGAVKTRARQQESEEEVSPATLATIRGLLQEGAPGKAAKHLMSDGLADPADPAVLQALRDLHPFSPPPNLDALPSCVPRAAAQCGSMILGSL